MCFYSSFSPAFAGESQWSFYHFVEVVDSNTAMRMETTAELDTAIILSSTVHHQTWECVDFVTFHTEFFMQNTGQERAQTGSIQKSGGWKRKR